MLNSRKFFQAGNNPESIYYDSVPGNLTMSAGNFGALNLDMAAFSFWFKGVNPLLGGQDRIIMNRNAADNIEGITLITNSNSLVFFINRGDTFARTGQLTTPTIPDLYAGIWHHFYMYFDRNAAPANRMKFFHNGIELVPITYNSPSTDIHNNPPVDFLRTAAGFADEKYWQFTFFGGATPPAITDVYDTINNRPIEDLSSVIGYRSEIVPTLTGFEDAVVATDWSSFGSATFSTDRP